MVNSSQETPKIKSWFIISQMCNSPSAGTYKTMNFTYFYNKMRLFCLFESLVGVIGLTVTVIFIFFFLDYRSVSKGMGFPSQNERLLWSRIDGEGGNARMKRIDYLGEIEGGCDVFDGDWVWDDNYPLYQSKDCRLMDDGFRCSENGRPDLLYAKWRWQPRRCNLPRFDANMMLEKLRNKRVVFAGDSVGRNQWESLLCMLSSAVSDNSSIYEVNGSPITKHKGFLVFKFADYNCTVEYYRAPFLVLQSRPPRKSPPQIKATVKLDEMDRMSYKWKDADILVLNTGHWWSHDKTIRGGCYFQQGLNVKMDMGIDRAYEEAWETTIRWIRHEVDATKTQVFLRTNTPVRFRGGNWRTGGTCHSETLPELGSSLVSSLTWAKHTIFAKVLASHSHASALGLLNITLMTSRRKDGHPSLYYLGPKRAPHPFTCRIAAIGAYQESPIRGTSCSTPFSSSAKLL